MLSAMMPKLLITLLLLLIQSWTGWSLGNLSRRDVCKRLTVGSVVSIPSIALARNLPEATGADLSQTGTLATLAPIVKIKNTLSNADKILSQQQGDLSQDLLQQTEKTLASIPTSEQDFKRIFDQYSDPVSYKQKYLDQNAFLVYYTRGYDGPNRPSIESDLPEKQTLQFGARNEAWVAWEGFVAEVRFAGKYPSESSPQELSALLQATIKAVDSYLSLAPPGDLLEQAKITDTVK